MTVAAAPAKCWLGADTHSDFHVLAVVDADGRRLEVRSFTTDPEGITSAAAWAHTHNLAGAGVEGTSSYGATLATALITTGISVVEVTRPNRQQRRLRGKSDELDALQAAQAARVGDRTSPVKCHPLLKELRTHYVFRGSAMKARTQVGNEIISLMKTFGLPVKRQTKTWMRTIIDQHPALAWAAQRWISLNDEIRYRDKQILGWLHTNAAELLERHGLGPISATQLILAAGLNPERTINQARFARLSGAAPIPISSGRRQHVYRLSRAGDRDANQALWRIAFTRSTRDPRTQTYIAKRLKKPNATKAGALRCIKRALCRELTPILHQIALRHTTPTT